MPFVTKKMNIKNAWVFVKPSDLKRYPYFTCLRRYTIMQAPPLSSIVYKSGKT